MKGWNFIALVSFTALISGCSSVDSTKFKNFTEAVEKLNENTETLSIEVQKRSRGHSVNKFATSPVSKPSDLQISINNYDWSMSKPPLYLKLKKVNIQLVQMNGVFEEYADLLAQMSSASISKEELVASAKELNAKSEGLSKTLDVEVPKGGLSIISSAALGIMQQYLDQKKSKVLDSSIKKNQASVEMYSHIQISLIRILKTNLLQTYSENYFEYGKQWTKSDSKNQLSERIFDLNDLFIDDLLIYENLEKSYAVLPAGHKQLLSTKNKNTFKYKIESLIKSTNKIMDVHKSVTKKGVNNES